MKKILKRGFQKKLKYLVWVWVIVLFLIMCHRKFAETRTIYEGKGDSRSVNFEQITGGHSWWSFIQGKDQSHEKIFAYVQQSDGNSESGLQLLENLLITRSTQGSEADIYEEDNQPWQAWPIVVNNPAQIHTFHLDTDVDWVYFFGHEESRYDMNADDGTTCNRFIKLSLTDPNGKIIISEAGLPIESPFCSLNWQCMKKGYYCLKIEPPSEYPTEGISYKLSIKEVQAAKPASIVFGRVVNSKQEGMNGLLVNLMASGAGQIKYKTLTGSIQNVQGNTLDQSKVDGWYYFPHIASGIYDLRVTDDDPNIIISDISIDNLELKRIDDIVSDFPKGEADVVSEFDLVYTQYQNMKREDLPVWEDKDKDGANNQYEILYGTDPDDPHNRPWDMELPGGWSMISIPVISENASVSKLFPGTEVVYAYEKGAGYKRVKKTEELEVGKGYWILLKKGKNYTLTGQSVYSYALSLNGDGWEMIGGCTYAAQPTTSNCNINVIYKFLMGIGYQRVPESENLEPGKGYWILINGIIDQCELTVETN